MVIKNQWKEDYKDLNSHFKKSNRTITLKIPNKTVFSSQIDEVAIQSLPLPLNLQEVE